MKVFHKIDYDGLISLDNMFFAWDEFKKGKMDKKDVMIFERHLEDKIFLLHQELKNQTYRHGPYTIFHIQDPKPRTINKATVRDRLVHHLVFGKLYQIFDPCFIFHSYSSRLGKGTHLGVANLADCLRRESRNFNSNIFTLKCDIRKFFNNIDHKILLHLIENKIKDSQFLWLVKEVVESFSVPNVNSVGGGVT